MRRLHLSMPWHIVYELEDREYSEAELKKMAYELYKSYFDKVEWRVEDMSKTEGGNRRWQDGSHSTGQ